jgi:hypothetical protein
VSITGVNGWYSANQLSPVGMESVGTNPLPRKGRKVRGMGRLLAASTVLAARPMATHSQVRARVIAARIPAVATHSTGPALGRNPMATATTRTMARLSMVWIMLPRTWPVRTAGRKMAMVRKRAMMPSVMSMATEMAVPWAPAATAISRIPGVTNSRYSARPPAGPPSPAPKVPPKT